MKRIFIYLHMCSINDDIFARSSLSLQTFFYPFLCFDYRIEHDNTWHFITIRTQSSKPTAPSTHTFSVPYSGQSLFVANLIPFFFASSLKSLSRCKTLSLVSLIYLFIHLMNVYCNLTMKSTLIQI